MYQVERKDGAGWFNLARYKSRTVATSHAQMIRRLIRESGQTDRGKVRVTKLAT